MTEHDAAGPARPSPDGERDLAATLDAVEALLLGNERPLRRRDVSSAASVSPHSARKYWRALGFPVVGEEEVRFTRSDLYALQDVVGLVRGDVIDEPTALAMTRAVARSTDRLAVWQTELMAESLAESLAAPSAPAATQANSTEADGASGSATHEAASSATEPPDSSAAADEARTTPHREIALVTAIRLAELADDLEPLLVYAWRRHLVAAISRMVTDADAEASAETSVASEGMDYTVGFADLVSFTRLVRRSSERRLAKLVQRFEALASDVVTAHGGRVIKTAGDEVMWMSSDPVAAADIALDLVDAMGQDDLLPDLRVGVATGQVVHRLGDVYGTTVNRASRLTALARPRGILVDGPTAAQLSLAGGFATAPGRPRALRGIGPVVPFTLHRTRHARRWTGDGDGRDGSDHDGGGGEDGARDGRARDDGARGDTARHGSGGRPTQRERDGRGRRRRRKTPG